MSPQHLTDFRGGLSNIRIRTVTLNQMLQLRPDDVFTRLRVLASLIAGLFGAMVLWGAVVGVQDKVGRRNLLKQVMSAEGPESCGFRQLATGEWLWALPAVVIEDNGHIGGAN